MLIIIETSAGYLVQADDGGGSGVHARRRLRHSSGLPIAPDPSQIFELSKPDRPLDSIRSGTVVTVKAASGNLLSARGTAIRADNRAADDSTRFIVEIKDGSDVVVNGTAFALRTSAGTPRCVVAEGGGGNAVHADREEAREWEPSPVALQSGIHVIWKARSTCREIGRPVRTPLGSRCPGVSW